jgi:hypothetical protein
MYIVRVLAAAGKKKRKVRVVNQVSYPSSAEGFREAVQLIVEAIGLGAVENELFTADGHSVTVVTNKYTRHLSEEQLSRALARALEEGRPFEEFRRLDSNAPGTRH